MSLLHCILSSDLTENWIVLYELVALYSFQWLDKELSCPLWACCIVFYPMTWQRTKMSSMSLLHCILPLTFRKIWNRVDCQHSEKRSKTHKRLKERITQFIEVVWQTDAFFMCLRALMCLCVYVSVGVFACAPVCMRLYVMTSSYFLTTSSFTTTPFFFFPPPISPPPSPAYPLPPSPPCVCVYVCVVFPLSLPTRLESSSTSPTSPSLPVLFWSLLHCLLPWISMEPCCSVRSRLLKAG